MLRFSRFRYIEVKRYDQWQLQVRVRAQSGHFFQARLDRNIFTYLTGKISVSESLLCWYFSAQCNLMMLEVF